LPVRVKRLSGLSAVDPHAVQDLDGRQAAGPRTERHPSLPALREARSDIGAPPTAAGEPSAAAQNDCRRRHFIGHHTDEQRPQRPKQYESA